LEAPYRASTYVADTPAGRLGIRVGQASEPLDRLLDDRGVTSWAYVTAYNPGSQRLPPEANAARQRQLEEAVRVAYATYRGEGVGDDGRWPPEPSLLILGIDEPAAAALGRRFGQAAIVCGSRGEAARLVWLNERHP
jgi:hypothetical protein